LPYLLIQEPAIVERRRGRPAGSMAGSTNRIDNSAQRELSAFERNTGYTGAGVLVEAAAPNLVFTTPRRALRSPTSQHRTILKVL